MSNQPQDDTQAALKHLWGTFVPSLDSDQVNLAVEVWQKIKVRKQGLAKQVSEEEQK